MNLFYRSFPVEHLMILSMIKGSIIIDWVDSYQCTDDIYFLNAIVERAIKHGMDSDMYYKDIYKLAKERIEMFADILGESPINLIQTTKTLTSSQ